MSYSLNDPDPYWTQDPPDPDRPKKKSEKRIQSEIHIRIGSRPDVRLIRVNAGKFRSMDGHRIIMGAPEGTPDLVGFLRVGNHCYPLGVECKTRTGRQRLAQKRVQRIFEQWGACYIVARSVKEVEHGIEIFKAKTSGL